MDSTKRKISRNHYNVFASELRYLQSRGIVDESQINDYLSIYEVHSPYSFTRVILGIASLLIGLGILTFIASNWQELTAWFKFALILVFLAGFGFASLITEEKYPKTSRSLLYLTTLIFGGGIFLIQQIFNITFQSTTELLLWGLAILPIAIVYKDIIILVASQMLIFSFLLTYDMQVIPLLILFAIYLAVYHILNSKHLENVFSSLAMIISVIGFLFKIIDLANIDEFIVAVIFFVLGLGMIYLNDIKAYSLGLINSVGVLIVLISGLFLTFEKTYYMLNANAQMISLIFTFGYSMLLLYWLKKGRIYSILLICSLILRFYFDLTLKFASKSLVFIIAGLILGAFGFWFEKENRERISKDDY